MSNPRPWLLLLVALILPFKGALAAAGMFCHASSPVPVSSIAATDHDHAGMSGHDHGPRAAADGEHGGGAHEHGGGPLPVSSCTICSAVCSAPPLPSAGLALAPLSAPGAERFPALAPPRPSAVAGGLERPPRTV